MRARVSLSLAIGCSVTLACCFANAAAPEPAEAFAIAGKPFGIGKVTIEFDSLPVAPDAPLRLLEAKGRALYPVFERTQLRALEAAETSGPGYITAWFLFRGEEPLKLTFRTAVDRQATVTPTSNEELFRPLLRSWWRRYAASAQQVSRDDFYPPLVENYLLQTLSRRLDLDRAAISSAWSPAQHADDVIALLTGAESVRIAAQTNVLLAINDSSIKMPHQPLPEPIATPPVRLPEWDASAVEIESIARHVPVECFYVRCGSFANFLWLRDRIDKWGTNLRHLTSVRGLDYQIGPKLERQLALRETVLGKLLGDTVISDVSIIGTDTFLREGAALGVIFAARNNAVLKKQFDDLREEALRSDETAKSSTIRIAGHDVSLVATPDNRIRSFYAVDGDYHLITTSQTLVRRFFEAGEGKDNLAAADEFRWARSKMPLANDYQAFIYLSDPFFRNIVGPHYRIEMTRRARAIAELDVLRVAQLAAKAEGNAAASIDELREEGYLPAQFGSRADKSSPLLTAGASHDSLRGGYGTFLPVPDVEIPDATIYEVEAYRTFTMRYNSEWRQMDPVVIGVQRKALKEKEQERVIFDVQITPYARSRYQFLANLLQAGDQRKLPEISGELASLSFNVATPWAAGKVGLGILDFEPRFAIVNGKVHYSYRDLHEFPLFLFVETRNGERGMLFQYEEASPPDADGFLKSKNGILFSNGIGWIFRKGNLEVYATERPVLKVVAPHAKLIDAERSAQLRLRIADLNETKAAAAIHAESYIRCRKVSAGNVAMMEMLAQQLGIKDEKAKEVAETLLDAKLACPLGGTYSIEAGFEETGRWQSSAWKKLSLHDESELPADFRAPQLAWLRGLLLEFSIDPTTLVTHIELDVRDE